MNKFLAVLILAGVFIYACGNSSEKKSTETKTEKSSGEKKEKSARKLQMVETSELALLMRTMENEMKSAKISIEGGFSYHDSLTFNYGNIHTAIPTEENMKKPGFEGHANAYLTQLEIFKNSAPEKRKENYNLLVNSCLNCHASHCPGPVNKIKELSIVK